MVSPARPSRESITLSSMWAQKGHFTRGHLLSDRQPTKALDIFHFAKITGLPHCNELNCKPSFQCDGRFLFFFRSHAFQFAQIPSFVKQHGDAQYAATGEGYGPQHHGGCYRGFSFYSKNRCVCNDGARLRAAANARQLNGRAHQCKCQDQQRVGEAEGVERSRETVGDPVIYEADNEPMQCGINGGENQIFPGADGLHAVHETEHDARQGAAPATGRNYGLKAPLQQSGTVESQIDQRDGGGQHAGEQNCAGGFGGGFQLARYFTRMRTHTEENQPDCGDHGNAGHIENALKDVDAEGVCDGQVLFFRQQERSDGFACAAEQKNGGESGQGELINLPEICFADVSLEDLPAQGADAVAGIDGHHGENDVIGIGVAHSVEQFGAAEGGEVKEIDRLVSNDAQGQQSKHDQYGFPG